MLTVADREKPPAEQVRGRAINVGDLPDLIPSPHTVKSAFCCGFHWLVRHLRGNEPYCTSNTTHESAADTRFSWKIFTTIGKDASLNMLGAPWRSLL